MICKVSRSLQHPNLFHCKVLITYLPYLRVGSYAYHERLETKSLNTSALRIIAWFISVTKEVPRLRSSSSITPAMPHSRTSKRNTPSKIPRSESKKWRDLFLSFHAFDGQFYQISGLTTVVDWPDISKDIQSRMSWHHDQAGGTHQDAPTHTHSRPTFSEHLPSDIRGNADDALHLQYLFVQSLLILDLFMHQSRYIRSLRLDMYWSMQELLAPTMFLTKVATWMQDLRELYLKIRQFEHPGNPNPQPNQSEGELMEILSCLTPLPLQSVTVIYLDMCLDPEKAYVDDTSYRDKWLMVPKREWAKRAREILLSGTSQ